MHVNYGKEDRKLLILESKSSCDNVRTQSFANAKLKGLLGKVSQCTLTPPSTNNDFINN